MNGLLALQLLGWLMVLLGGFLFVPLAAAGFYGEPLTPFVASIGLCLGVGLPVGLGLRPSSLRVRPRDGFLIVSSAWVVASVVGAVPYVFAGLFGPVDAFFESVAGFTTTGSTVLTDIEGTHRSLLLWRSLTQWLGGMGIVVFTIALMPILGIGGMQLFKAEVPGPVTEKISPRVSATARRLWAIYVGLTAAQVVALLICGVEPYHALNHALTTLSTGGFSTFSNSAAGFQSPACEWVVIVFMILAGMNFVLHYRLLMGRWREVLSDQELRYYIAVVVLAIVAIAIAIEVVAPPETADDFRSVVFSVTSIVTTTGYGTADFELWPPLAHLVLLGLMFLGAMSGSTSGGIKSLRAVLVLSDVRAHLGVAAHRNAIQPKAQYGGRPVAADVIAGVWIFCALYLTLVALGSGLIAAHGYDILTAVSAGLTSVGNVGPGLGEIGPYDHFAHFPVDVKLALSGCMLAGRLEIFTLLVLFTPGFWQR